MFLAKNISWTKGGAAGLYRYVMYPQYDIRITRYEKGGRDDQNSEPYQKI